MMFLKYSKKTFLLLFLIFGVYILYKTFKKKTIYDFNNQYPNKFIRYECIAGACGGWGKI